VGCTSNIAYAHYVGPRVPHYEAFDSGSGYRKLERTLAMLSRWFTFASLDEVIGGTAVVANARPPIALTFDDGFDMLGGPLLEMLRRHGVSATAFVITTCVDNQHLMWRSKLSAVLALRSSSSVVGAYADLACDHGLPPVARADAVLRASRDWPMEVKDGLADELWERCAMPPVADYLERYRPYFSWDGLRRWTDAGHSVGLHTATHPDCSRLEPSAADAEVVAPAALLRAELGLESVPFSYPFGCRLPSEVERSLVREGVVTCALGVAGFSPAGTAPERLERACIEHVPLWDVFGRTLVGSFTQAAGCRLRSG
jgi:peptidoglycan/xylan/chitin deacetylase (PgdA/CDA1 family)